MLNYATSAFSLMDATWTMANLFGTADSILNDALDNGPVNGAGWVNINGTIDIFANDNDANNNTNRVGHLTIGASGVLTFTRNGSYPPALECGLEDAVAVLTHAHFTGTTDGFVAGDRINVTLDVNVITGNTGVALTLEHTANSQYFKGDAATTLASALNCIKVNGTEVSWDASTTTIKLYNNATMTAGSHVATLTVTESGGGLTVTGFAIVSSTPITNGPLFATIPATINSSPEDILVTFAATSAQIVSRTFTLGAQDPFKGTLAFDSVDEHGFKADGLTIADVFDSPTTKPNFTDGSSNALTGLSRDSWNTSTAQTVYVYNINGAGLYEHSGSPLVTGGTRVGTLAIEHGGTSATFKPENNITINYSDKDFVAVVEHSHFATGHIPTGFRSGDTILVPIVFDVEELFGENDEVPLHLVEVTNNPNNQLLEIGAAHKLIEALNSITIGNGSPNDYVVWADCTDKEINIYNGNQQNGEVATLTLNVVDGKISGVEFKLDNGPLTDSNGSYFASIPATVTLNGDIKVTVLVPIEFEVTSAASTGRVFELNSTSNGFGATLTVYANTDGAPLTTTGALTIENVFGSGLTRPTFESGGDTLNGLTRSSWDRSAKQRIRVYNTNGSIPSTTPALFDNGALPPAPGAYVGTLIVAQDGTSATFEPAGGTTITDEMDLVAVVQYGNLTNGGLTVTNAIANGANFGTYDVILVPLDLTVITGNTEIAINLVANPEPSTNISLYDDAITAVESEWIIESGAATSLVTALNGIKANGDSVNWQNATPRTIKLYSDATRTSSSHVATLTFDVNGSPSAASNPAFALVDSTFALNNGPATLHALIPASDTNLDVDFTITFTVNGTITVSTEAQLLAISLNPLELEDLEYLEESEKSDETEELEESEKSDETDELEKSDELEESEKSDETEELEESEELDESEKSDQIENLDYNATN